MKSISVKTCLVNGKKLLSPSFITKMHLTALKMHVHFLHKASFWPYILFVDNLCYNIVNKGMGGISNIPFYFPVKGGICLEKNFKNIYEIVFILYGCVAASSDMHGLYSGILKPKYAGSECQCISESPCTYYRYDQFHCRETYRPSQKAF